MRLRARKSNPQRMNDYLREQERRAANPDEWVFWHRIWEDRSLRPLVNLVAEQWPNLVTSIALVSLAARLVVPLAVLWLALPVRLWAVSLVVRLACPLWVLGSPHPV